MGEVGVVAGRVNGFDVGWLQRRWVAQVVAFERVVAGFEVACGRVVVAFDAVTPTGKFYPRATGDAGPLDPIDKIR
jgi:hypothetical protein